MGGFAWVTLATNDSYSLGALVLAHSLKAVGTTHQLAVLVTPGVTNAMRDKLSAVFNLIEEVNVLDSRDEANLRLLKRPELGITFTKLHCWRLTQYEKCVFLDADTLVLQQCDELFEREELSAAPDVGWPDCFNSGVFVYRPSLETYDKLIQFALEKGSFDGGDQGLLNLYFSDWAHKDISRHLPFIYNMCSTACYSYLPAYKQFGANAKIIHFIGAQKPWLQYFNTESRKVQPSADSSHLQEVLQRWWDIFCSLIHPHLSPAMPQGQLQHAVSPSYFPPQYAPPPNPTSSADDYENAWDPWDEYDRKVAQSSHYTSAHYIQNQPIESLNTNASHVADQPTIYSQPQSQNVNTNFTQNNSFYQPISQPVYQHVPRVPSPPPSLQPQHQTTYYQPQPQYHHPEPPQSHHPEPQHHHHEPQNQHLHHDVPHNQHTHPHNHQHQEHIHQNPSSHHHQPYYEHSQHDNNHQYTNHPPKQTFNQDEHSCPPIAESFPLCSDRPTSPIPNRPDPEPILPKECEATTTVSNDMSLSSTIEDCNKQDSAGLAGAFAQLTLGVPRTQEQDAFENVLRKQAWEVGNIDYLGRDSFDNIWSKISETLGAETTTSLALAPEPEPSAPAQSQSESAPPQEEVKPVQSSDAPIETTTATDNLKVDLIESSALVESSQDQQQIPQATSESAIVPPSTETVEPEPQVPGSTVSDVVKEGESQPLPEIAPTPKESVAEPAVCPIPQKKEAKVEEPKVTEPQVDVPKEEIKIPDPQAAVTTIDAKPTEPQVESTEASSIPQTKEADSKVAEPELPKETVTSGELVCSLPEQKDVPKLPDAQAISSQPEQKEAQVPSAQPETPKAAQPEVAKVTPQVEETSKEPIPAATKELDTSQPAEALPEKPEISAQPVPSPAEPAVKEVQAASEATASKGTKKAASSKDSPRTKVTEATPPATPGSPLVEKTKEALAAEASIPDTPPPTEGGSTPTPPPRKTDKPKKVAAKPKK